MEPAYLLEDGRAGELLKQGSWDEDDTALLEVWFFHKKPPEVLAITLNDTREYGLSRHGERLGTIDDYNCARGHVYLDGDNGVSYYGKFQEKNSGNYLMRANKASLEKARGLLEEA